MIFPLTNLVSGPGVAQLHGGGGGGAAVDSAPGGHGRVLRGAGARSAARRALHRGIVFNNFVIDLHYFSNICLRVYLFLVKRNYRRIKA